MTEETQSPLWTWAEHIPSWQSDLLRRLMERDELSAEDAEEVLANVTAAQDPIAPELRHGRRLEQGDLPAMASGAGSARLTAITDVARVGALHAKASLTFATTGLTVIYGDNGAGKSTFARLLKQACRARVQDDNVHPNVFREDSTGPQTYTVKAISDGSETSFNRGVGDGPEPALGSVSVFDAACADHYIAKGDGPAYVPRAIQLLERLARAQNRLREEVTERKRELERSRPDFSGLPRPTAAASAVSRDDLDVATVERLTTLDESELARLSRLEELLTSTTRNDERLETLERKQRQREQLRERMLRLEQSASLEAVERWRALTEKSDELAAMLATLGAEQAGVPLGPVGTRAWVTLWNAARAFFDECAPKESWGERCPLCQQGLGGHEHARFAAFQALATNQVEDEHQATRAEADAARDALQRAQQEASQLAQECGLERWSGPLADFANRVETWLAAALDGRPGEPPGACPLKELDDAITACRDEAEELTALEDADKRATLDAERDELLARRQLAERRDEALRWVAALRRIRELDAVHSALSTNKLSRDQKKLADELLTQRLGEEMDRARKDLGVPGLRVQLDAGTQKGRPLVKLSLPKSKKTKLEDVFSAGERRSLALAFFLAEIAAAEHDGTIVLDDPVSSLDADRRRWVAMRLIEEAKRRQVIVFTHDPHFLILLRREAKGAKPHVLTCKNVNGTAGYVSDDEPWTTSTAKKLAKTIRTQYLREAVKHHGEQKLDDYQRTMEAALKQLRKAWERAVSELLCGVIEPGSFEVHTQKLREIVVTDEMAKAVAKGMSVLSFDAHDQGTCMPQTLPSVEELEDLVSELEDFLRLVDDEKKARKQG